MGPVFVVGVSEQVMDLLLAAKASPWMPEVNEQAEMVGVGECWGKGWKGC